MRNLIVCTLGLLSLALMQSCGEVKMDPAAVAAKVDSLAAIKIEEAAAQANTDCETRMATEVKSLADSIVNATKAATSAQ